MRLAIIYVVNFRYNTRFCYKDQLESILHNPSGPAVMSRDDFIGNDAYYLDDRLHRVDGPARSYVVITDNKWALQGRKLLYAN